VGAPQPDSNASGQSQDEEKKHWIIIGLSVGAAVLVAVSLLLTLGFFAYRARQRAARRNGASQHPAAQHPPTSILH
jgi:heme/copper-type cytochrome/quinol oxidase subunit 2